jgi:quinol monooxygenase YgiN
MFIARIELRITAGQRDDFRKYAASEGLAARELTGCVDFAFCEYIGDPDRVLLYEEWSTREAFDAYKGSAMFAASGARLMPMLAEAPKSAYYESENIFDRCAVR